MVYTITQTAEYTTVKKNEKDLFKLRLFPGGNVRLKKKLEVISYVTFEVRKKEK